jgi:uncharacterized protein involved in exopolysaccharide biosynthesis
MADSTNQFLQAQLEDARRRLIEHEKKLEDFRQRNAGRLPSQMQSNLQMMQSTQQQMQSLLENANRDRDRLMAIEQLLAEAAAAPPPAPTQVVIATTGEPTAGATVATNGQQLELARLALRNLETRLKPEHPDVIRTKRLISELEGKVLADAEATAAARKPTTPGGAPVQATPLAQSRAADLRFQAEEIRRRLESNKEQYARLEKVMAGYSTRLEATPALESELSELMRDYSTLQEAYTVLLKKSEESKIAVNLERRQIGQQFRIIDSPRLPERPISPNRSRLNLMGFLAGLGVGLGLVALLEYRDTTVKTDDDVILSLSLPVLAVIPAMVTHTERRTRRRHMILGLSASLAMGLVMAAVAAAWKLGYLRGLV